MPLDPIAFLSYAHIVDKRGHITEFRERLSDEVHLQSGHDFPIFQDRKDISWGQNWRQRLEQGLDAATFLIPIITPGYFTSDECRRELERFLEHERGLHRDDLVLPVYYVNTPLLNDEPQRNADPLAAAIADHQWVDWRDLRFDPYTSPQVAKALAKIAAQVCGALARTAPAEPPAPARPRLATMRAEETTAQEAASATPKAGPGRAPAAKAEPPTLVVCQMHRGDHTSISEAIAAAQPGARILVQPGRYLEGLAIDKPLEIVGDGSRGDIIVEATGADAVLFSATMGRVANLTLQQTGGGEWYAVDIAQGRLQLEDCDISSESLSSVAVHGGADPRIRRNRIHDGNQAGVFVYENGLGVLEDNDVSGNASSSVLISEGGNPTLRRNRIHGGHASGVYVHSDGLGLLEDNDILGNSYAGVTVESGGRPTLRRNRISENSLYGVRVRESGGGTFEDNDLRGNARGPWFISEDSLPNVKRSGNIEQ